MSEASLGLTLWYRGVVVETGLWWGRDSVRVG